MPTTKPKDEVIQALKARLVLDVINMCVFVHIWLHCCRISSIEWCAAMKAATGHKGQRIISRYLSCNISSKSHKLVPSMQVQGAGKNKGHPRGWCSQRLVDEEGRLPVSCLPFFKTTLQHMQRWNQAPCDFAFLDCLPGNGIDFHKVRHLNNIA